MKTIFIAKGLWERIIFVKYLIILFEKSFMFGVYYLLYDFIETFIIKLPSISQI